MTDSPKIPGSPMMRPATAGGGGGDNIKVAVRVRPFNAREKSRDSTLIIKMSNKATTIIDPSGEKEPKTFSFDHSYWSHDGFEEAEDKSLKKISDSYASQADVFDDMGQGVLQNALQGFNTTLFAYGQTGSGKSYSMMGYGPNQGIVPLTFEALFAKIAANEDPNIRFQMSFSMLEIYMEAVDDLLVNAKDKKKGGLKIRQSPSDGGFFVDGLSKVPVSSYDEISALMDRGTANRTVAATQMNATSSRAHTIVSLQFDQIITGEDKKKMTRQSQMYLVDLAGSERAGSTGATGDRLKEGAMINKSLSALGNVIAALSKGKKAPFRDSVLTKLLQNALGGNSKTIMIAALSPADINYDETLSTLRFADRAKQIKNKATVNENETDKLIREMREENKRLKEMLESGTIPTGVSTTGMSEDEVTKMKKKMEADIRAQLKESEANTARMDENEFEKRLAEVKAKYDAESEAEELKTSRMANTPHLLNLNEDSALSRIIVHFLEEGTNVIGRKTKHGEEAPQVMLAGLSIEHSHAVAEVSSESVKLTQTIPEVAEKMLVNGLPLCGEVVLNHLDRLLFGTNHLYLFYDPAKAPPTAEDDQEMDWEWAQQEIITERAKRDTLDASLPQHIKDEIRILIPMIQEANAISQELDKRRFFEFNTLTGGWAGLPVGESKAMIKMTNSETKNVWMLTKDDFENRHARMQEVYRKAQLDNADDDDGNAKADDDEDEDEEEETPEQQKANDPFYHVPGFVIVGIAELTLENLVYEIPFEDDSFIQDSTGQNVGTILMTLHPCDADGVIKTEALREEPKDALGKPMSFRLSVESATFKSQKWSRQKVSYEAKYIEGGEENITEEAVPGDYGVTWNHPHIVTLDNVDDEVLDWLQSDALTMKITSFQSDDVVNTGQRTQLSTLKLFPIIDEYRAKTRSADNAIEAIDAILYAREPCEAVAPVVAAPTPDLSEKVKQLEAELAEGVSQSELKATEAEEKVTKEAADKVITIEQLTTELSDVKAKATEEESSKLKEIADLKTQLDELVSKQLEDSKRKQIEELEAEATSTSDKDAEIVQLIAQHHDAVTDLRSQLEKVTSELSQSREEVIESKNQLESSQNETATLRSKLSDTTTSIQINESLLEKSNADLNDLQSKFSMAQKELGSMTVAHKAATTTWGEEEAKLKATIESQKIEMEEKIKTLENQLADSSKTNAEKEAKLVNELKTVETTSKDLETQLAETSGHLEQTKSERDDLKKRANNKSGLCVLM
eukprot:m.122188 g.122188  ORF g.122188 m.122188 type:complete len:1254 (+) comp28906_c0_seq1:110-3871(+)